MPLNKGVEGSLTGSAGGVPDSQVAVDSAGASEDRVIRRRRRHHHRHQNLARRSGRGVEIAVVTLLALAILFGVLYYLLPHYQAQGHGEESRVLRASGFSVQASDFRLRSLKPEA